MATQHLIDPSRLSTEVLSGYTASGVVSTVIGDDVVVLHEGASSLARRAASCLLVPREGDRVLLATVERRLFVLAILERSAGESTIEVEGDLHVRSRSGAVTIAGRTLTLAAQHASWVAESASILAEHLSLDATRLRHVSSFSERIAESVKETFGRSYREIREAEHVNAGTLTFSLRGVLRAHAETAIVTAKKLVKLNADQVHLG